VTINTIYEDNTVPSDLFYFSIQLSLRPLRPLRDIFHVTYVMLWRGTRREKEWALF